MKESISYTFLLNIIIVFIAISFFAIMAIMSYSKAFRINSKIVNALEMYEGYNELSKDRIDEILTSYGYQRTGVTCKKKSESLFSGELVNTNGDKSSDGTCISFMKNSLDSNKSGYRYKYGVTTYMSFDFPIIGKLLRIPVYTKTRTMTKLG